jgi:hypothetical protein
MQHDSGTRDLMTYREGRSPRHRRHASLIRHYRTSVLEEFGEVRYLKLLNYLHFPLLILLGFLGYYSKIQQ